MKRGYIMVILVRLYCRMYITSADKTGFNYSRARFVLIAMNAAKSLGVDPVVSAKEMSDPDVDHIGVMAYAARLESLTPKKKPSSSQHRVMPTAVSSPPPPPGKELHKEELSLAEAVKIVASNQPAYVNKKVCFFVLQFFFMHIDIHIYR